MDREFRPGFTLLELIVVLFVISVLVSLLMPAVQNAREAARRAACGNNLRQIGIALHNYGSETGYVPPQMTTSTDGVHIFLGDLAAHVRLLPYLDQAPLYAQVYWSDECSQGHNSAPASSWNAPLLETPVAVFVCPSDTTRPGNVNYRISMGVSRGTGYVLPRTATSAMPGIGRVYGMRLTRITDGLSHTAAFSERIVGDFDNSTLRPTRDIALVPFYASTGSLDEFRQYCRSMTTSLSPHDSFAGATWLYALRTFTGYDHILSPNDRTVDCQYSGARGSAIMVAARSWHPGGVQLLLMDGQVRFVNENIEYRLWRALATVDAQDDTSGF